MTMKKIITIIAVLFAAISFSYGQIPLRAKIVNQIANGDTLQWYITPSNTYMNSTNPFNMVASQVNLSGQFNMLDYSNVLDSLKVNAALILPTSVVRNAYNDTILDLLTNTSTRIGYMAGRINKVGANTFIGRNAGYTNSLGGSNVFIGDASGYLSRASQNTLIGASAGASTTNGGTNTFIGYAAGLQNITGTGSVMIGNEAGVYEKASNSFYIHNGTGTITNMTQGRTNSFMRGTMTGTPATSYIVHNANDSTNGSHFISGNTFSGDAYGDSTVVKSSFSVRNGINAYTGFRLYHTPLGKPTFNIKNSTGSEMYNMDSIANVRIAGNLGIGTTSVGSYNLSFIGTAAKTIGVERTTGTTGNTLTINSGGAVSGGTDRAGGNLILSSGISTGTAGSSIDFYTPIPSATGTTDNTPSIAMSIDGNANVTGRATLTSTSFTGNLANAVSPGDTLYTTYVNPGRGTYGVANQNGNSLILSSGMGTGYGTQATSIRANTRYAIGATTTDHMQYDRFIVPGDDVLLDNTNDTLFSITPANSVTTIDTTAGGVISYSVNVTDGTDSQVESGTILYAGVVKSIAGVPTATTNIVFGTTSQALSSGTLTGTLSMVWNQTTKAFYVIVSYNSSLTPTGMRIMYTVTNGCKSNLTYY